MYLIRAKTEGNGRGINTEDEAAVLVTFMLRQATLYKMDMGGEGRGEGGKE